MEFKVGRRYSNRNKERHRFEDVVITKIYQKENNEVKYTAPDDRDYYKDLIGQYKGEPHENAYVTAEYVYKEGSFDTAKQNFERVYEEGRRLLDPKDKHAQKLIGAMFDAFVAGVFSSGGDGGGSLLTKDYDFRELANMFGEYKPPRYSTDGTKSPGDRAMKDMYVRVDRDDSVSFSDLSNESFVIGPALPSSKAHPFDDVFIVF